jgi:hypothetical protein
MFSIDTVFNLEHLNTRPFVRGPIAVPRDGVPHPSGWWYAAQWRIVYVTQTRLEQFEGTDEKAHPPSTEGKGEVEKWQQ